MKDLESHVTKGGLGGAAIVSLSQIQGPPTPEKDVQRRIFLDKMSQYTMMTRL